ncbi:winged helix DNA-binding domain-containing protein [Allorhizocola rhizosphaerae]|uniref:winged helix DNA-binding domain-containing protein n=1 Tax=Allorhizocola rhizosphaerae TaxID=1872709 RepID=UPI000E3B93D7|nr:winged helix DNA-binding domain-containing protein [Allorhizocola rhizosphaerae]
MVDRRWILGYRVRAQQLDRPGGGALDDTAVLDVGVQDTGPDGGMWALAIRGIAAEALAPHDLILLWTLRGAPHLYRRADTSAIIAAAEPYSEADAGKRIFDAAKPLKAAGLGNLEALDEAAKRMRAIVTRPMTKGDVSARVAAELPAPYLRFCRACNATHMFEMTFRFAATHAGLELQPGTSPPVLQRIKGFKRARAVGERFDLVRGYLRLFGPATPKQVAEFLDAPVKEVKARWPTDTVEVRVAGETRWLLAGAPEPAEFAGARLLGPYDLFLQARDRKTLVPDADRAGELWPVIGRPGAVLANGDLVGSWRPRSSGGKLTVAVQPWGKLSAPIRRAIAEQAERLSAHRGVALKAVDY